MRMTKTTRNWSSDFDNKNPREAGCFSEGFRWEREQIISLLLDGRRLKYYLRFLVTELSRSIVSIMIMITMKIDPQPVAIRESASCHVAGRSAICKNTGILIPPYAIV